MALNSINTNQAAMYAQANIGRASTSASSSIARLSSGNRIVRAADDVAAMSAGTSLRTNVTTLRRALINASQGSSLLQVADGALSQITDILQRQKAIAVQASGGTLTSSERSFLNQEFQNLTQEIDRISGQTNFNGVKLLNGALSEAVNVAGNSAIGDRASASITFSANIADGTALVINGQTIDFDLTAAANVEVVIGGTIEQTLDNAVTYLNSTTNASLSTATYSRQGNSLVITSKSAGTNGSLINVNTNMATSTALSATGAAAGARIGTVNGAYDRKITAVISGITATSTTVDATTGAAGGFTAGAIQVQNNADATVTAYTVLATDSIQNVVDGINGNTATHGVSARIGGYAGAYTVILERNYNNADETSVNLTAAGAALATLTAGADVTHTRSSLTGGTDDGLGAGRTVATGSVGNDVLTGLNQSKAKVVVSFPEIGDDELLDTANFGTQRVFTFTTNAGATSFGFINGTAVSDNEVSIGATLEETLDNFVSAFNKYQGVASSAYSFDQVEARREGLDVIFESKVVGDVNDIDATAFVLTAAPGITGVGTIGDFSNGVVNGGVDVTGVTNKDFIGKVGGFSATYNGTSDTVDLAVTVGGNSYTATSVDTTATSDTLVRMTSKDGGGYFDIYLAANEGTDVDSQSEANTFADRLNAAFASLNFSQKRQVSSYTGNAPIVTDNVVTGSLIGTSVDIQLDDFTSVKIDKIEIEAPSGSRANGSIAITVNGERFESINEIGSQLGANGVFKLTSTEDANRVIEFRTGDTAIEFDTAAKAAAFEDALREAFGVGDGSAALSFQIGTASSDALEVSLGNVDTNTLFDGASVDVLTQASAIAAGDVIDSAIKIVTSVRAEVGALQSRFDFASANVESSIQNQDAARGTLLDTDVASEATAYATAQVQLQAGISVLAQANQLPQNLLKLIG